MLVTKDGKKVGKTIYRARVEWHVALADPNACGNGGLEGLDEFSESREFPNLGLARAWAKQLTEKMSAKHGGWAFCDVEEGEYERESFVAPRYGRVVDGLWRGDKRVARGVMMKTGFEWEA